MTGRSAVQNTAKRHSKFKTLSYGDFPFLRFRRPQTNKLIAEKPLCHRSVADVLFQCHFATCFVEVLTFFEIKIFGDVTPCQLINTVWLNIGEVLNLLQHCCANLKSRKVHLLIWGNKMPTRCNRWFLLQILFLAQHVSGTTKPIIRSSRVL